MAAGLTKLLADWRDYTEDRQVLMKQQLERLLNEPGLSNNVREVVERVLAES